MLRVLNGTTYGLLLSDFSVNFGVRQGSVLNSTQLHFNLMYIWMMLLNDCVNRKFIIVYADDILLIAQSVSELRNLLRACEKELITIDMKINVKNHVVCGRTML